MRTPGASCALTCRAESEKKSGHPMQAPAPIGTFLCGALQAGRNHMYRGPRRPEKSRRQAGTLWQFAKIQVIEILYCV
jgi:hypothetical protein